MANGTGLNREQILQKLLEGGGFAPNIGFIDSVFNNPALDSTMTLKSPAQTVGSGNINAPQGGAGPTGGGPTNQQINPQTLGLINLASQLAQSILGGRENTVLGGVAGVTGDVSKNIIFSQLLSSLSGGQEGGSGTQPNPFNLLR